VIDYRCHPILSRNQFAYHRSANALRIAHTEVVGLEGKPAAGWSVVGWIPNERLPYSRGEALAEHDTWVAILYQNEHGEEVWFHWIADKGDLPTGYDRVNP
jgi:hypothetical protein